MEAENKKNEMINIELDAEVAEGVFSNFTVISHSNSEFIVDFIKMMPGMPKAKVKSRVVLTPEHAKKLFRALHDNISKYESINGPIKDNDRVSPNFNLGEPKNQA